METNEFDRSDFTELLDMAEKLRGGVKDLQGKAESFCSSFSSGLAGVNKVLTKLNIFPKLSGDLDKSKETIDGFSKWITRNGKNLSGKWMDYAKAPVQGLATMSEMTYNTLKTIASLDELKDLKITTNVDENKKALESILGTGERVGQLFDELESNPLLAKIGIEDKLTKFRSQVNVLQGGKDRLAGLMTTFGEGKETTKAVIGDVKQMLKFNPLKGFGSAVGAIFKKKEAAPGEEGKKSGLFSIFRKKDEGDKNWFTAVARRSKEFGGQMKERAVPLMNYGVGLLQNYAPAFGVASNVMNLKKLGGKFSDDARIGGLEMAKGWGIGDEAKNQAGIDRITGKGKKRDEDIQGKMDKINSFQGKANDINEKLKRFGANPEGGEAPDGQLRAGISPISQGRLQPPDITENMPNLLGGADSGSPVTITIDRLVENLNVKSENLTEGIAEIRDIVVSELSRIVFNANKMAVQ